VFFGPVWYLGMILFPHEMNPGYQLPLPRQRLREREREKDCLPAVRERARKKANHLGKPFYTSKIIAACLLACSDAPLLSLSSFLPPSLPPSLLSYCKPSILEPTALYGTTDSTPTVIRCLLGSIGSSFLLLFGNVANKAGKKVCS
jgi:hypothetical protein